MLFDAPARFPPIAPLMICKIRFITVPKLYCVLLSGVRVAVLDNNTWSGEAGSPQAINRAPLLHPVPEDARIFFQRPQPLAGG
jgi:hypothetical protein